MYFFAKVDLPLAGYPKNTMTSGFPSFGSSGLDVGVNNGTIITQTRHQTVLIDKYMYRGRPYNSLRDIRME